MKVLRYVVVYVLLGLTALFLYTHETIAVPVSKPLSDIPIQFDTWTMAGQSRFSPEVLKQLKPSDYLFRVYKDAQGNKTTLYLGYHSGGPDSGPIHSPKHCLPGSGWYEVSEKRYSIPIDGGTLPVVQAIYQKGGQYELFLYYFQVKGKTLTDEYSLKLAEIFNSMLHKRRDSAFIRISVPFSDDREEAIRLGEKFAADIYPYITSALPL